MSVILVVDDEPLQREILRTILTEDGHEAYTASSGENAVEMARTYSPEIVLTDLKMEGIDGIELMERIKTWNSGIEFIIMTAFGTVNSAVDAIKKGAFNYLTKPLDKEGVLLSVRHAAERVALIKRNAELQNALFGKFRIEEIIGRSGAIKEIVNVINKVSKSNATVLILGESGTGKELIAKAIHYNSLRNSKTFTAINCAAIPENLLESELFGYEPGAFTGAVTRKKGLFEAAGGGTMFLDEIGDLPLTTQSKILRVLQEKEIRRLGGRETIKVDVRIIAATNKDLEKEMKTGRFREDLYYRLRVVAIEVPSLRERKVDISELVSHFVGRYNNEFGKRIINVDSAAMNAIIGYHWPGNIRQLESVIERAVLMCESDTITLQDIKSELRLSGGQGMLDIEIPDEGINFEEIEKELLKQAMIKSNYVAAKAARLLGMSYKTFWYRLEKFGLNNSVSLKKEEVP